MSKGGWKAQRVLRISGGFGGGFHFSVGCGHWLLNACIMKKMEFEEK